MILLGKAKGLDPL